jgi:hypothetical protein
VIARRLLRARDTGPISFSSGNGRNLEGEDGRAPASVEPEEGVQCENVITPVRGALQR